MDRISDFAVITAVARSGPRDRLLTFLTRGQGAVRLFARRLPRRPAPPAFFEPLQGGELLFTRPREGAHGRLVSFVPQRVWPGVREDLWRTVHALAFLESLNASVTEGCPQPELFSLLVRFLDRLETERRPGLARALATLRLLALNGIAPSLASCAGCNAPVPAGTGAPLSLDAGGVICGACPPPPRGTAIPVTPAAHGFMARGLALPEGQARRLRATPAVEREVSRLLDAFFEARTGFRPRCGSYIERLEAA